MYQYYAAPIRCDRRTLHVNPLSGDCVMARSPHDAHIRLGLPGAGRLFAVWALTEGVTLEQAGAICSATPPTRIFVSLGSEVIFPLGLDPALDVTLEGLDAGSD